MPTYVSPGVHIEKARRDPSMRQLRTTGLTGFVGVTEQGPLNTLVTIRSWQDYQEHFGGMINHAYLPGAVKGYFENNGQACTIVRVAHSNDQDHKQNAARASLVLPGDNEKITIRCEARDEGSWGNQLSLNVIPLADQSGLFHLWVQYKNNVEQHAFLSLDANHPQYAMKVINQESRWIKLCIDQYQDQVPKQMLPLENQYLENGQDGYTAMAANDFIGSSKSGNEATGLHLLMQADELKLLSCPDAVNPNLFSKEAYLAQAEAIQKNMISLCENHGLAFCLLDGPQGYDLQQTAEWRKKFDSSYGALYYPWLNVLHHKKLSSLPPSGHMAGVITRLDREDKLKKQPANEPVLGVVSLSQEVNEQTRNYLNPINVNAFRVVKGRGIRIWGARTLSSSSSWKYINTRRLMAHIKQSLSEDMRWVTFENNNESLWYSVARCIKAFCLELWKAGYFAGSNPEEAYYVKCDEELNPPEMRNAGILTVEIGLALAKPAEFIIVRLQEKTKEES